MFDPDLVDLQARLGVSCPGLRLERVDEVGSTNTELLERARAGDASACLLMADEQTAGRGRLGRAWRSRRGDSLTFSLALPLAPSSWSGLSLAVGTALADALDPPHGDQAAVVLLKWPNDLLLRDDGPAEPGRKLGGILIETVAVGAQRMAVIGVGLNLRAPDVADAAYGVAGWREVESGADAVALLARLAPPLVAAVLQFEREGFAAFAARFTRRDALLGRVITTSQPGLPQGRASGVDDTGALRVRALGSDPGPVRLVAAGEVSVRPMPAAQRG